MSALALSSIEPSGAAGLDFTLHMRSLCCDLAQRLPELRHIRFDRVAVRICQTRHSASHGVHASLTPLRFQGGERTTQRRGQTWTIRPLLDARGAEMLYLLSFYLPRFCNQPLAEKLATVIHELWHIGPAFDGDLRRLPGRCFAHGHSEKVYHQQMHGFAAQWLALEPPRALYAFLEYDFRELRARHGMVYGTKIPNPRLIRVAHKDAG